MVNIWKTDLSDSMEIAAKEADNISLLFKAGKEMNFLMHISMC